MKLLYTHHCTQKRLGYICIKVIYALKFNIGSTPAQHVLFKTRRFIKMYNHIHACMCAVLQEPDTKIKQVIEVYKRFLFDCMYLSQDRCE